MRIVACVKAVPDTDNIKPSPNGGITVSGEYAIGQYDLNAIETAAKLKAALPGSTVTVLMAAADEIGCTSKIKKSALSRGADDLFAVVDPGMKNADCLVTATVLAKAVEKLGDAEIVICGEGSGDIYNQQTGVMLGALLGFTTLNAVSAVSPCGDGLAVKRALENETEEFTAALPAVLSVTSDINVPRIASLKDIMAAGRKPSTVSTIADVGADPAPGVKRVSLRAPEHAERGCDVIQGDDSDAVAELYEKLRKVL